MPASQPPTLATADEDALRQTELEAEQRKTVAGESVAASEASTLADSRKPSPAKLPAQPPICAVAGGGAAQHTEHISKKEDRRLSKVDEVPKNSVGAALVDAAMVLNGQANDDEGINQNLSMGVTEAQTDDAEASLKYRMTPQRSDLIRKHAEAALKPKPPNLSGYRLPPPRSDQPAPFANGAAAFPTVAEANASAPSKEAGKRKAATLPIVGAAVETAMWHAAELGRQRNQMQALKVRSPAAAPTMAKASSAAGGGAKAAALGRRNAKESSQPEKTQSVKPTDRLLQVALGPSRKPMSLGPAVGDAAQPSRTQSKAEPMRAANVKRNAVTNADVQAQAVARRQAVMQVDTMTVTYPGQGRAYGKRQAEMPDDTMTVTYPGKGRAYGRSQRRSRVVRLLRKEGGRRRRRKKTAADPSTCSDMACASDGLGDTGSTQARSKSPRKHFADVRFVAGSSDNTGAIQAQSELAAHFHAFVFPASSLVSVLSNELVEPLQAAESRASPTAQGRRS